MTIKINPTTKLTVKGLILTAILTTLIPKTAQAQSIPIINIPTITLPKTTITVPKPTIKVPKPTIKIEIPTVTNAQNNIFQQPTNFVIEGATDNTSPSFISAIKEGSNIPQIQTGRGSTTVSIPNATTTISNINVVLPSTNIVAPGDVNLNVNTTEIPTFGSLVNTVNLSFPLPTLD
ncbi:hypothetical protein A0J48_015625 [Sphaerospermopsis aphanizomenoides BCCUSP55]|uniref:hypothetical protein n=1 Tax=Sphaerospermopsis aphanizomenoides TaxID=459663 RepID=UPI001906B465|nr:hypothetical protein [Sphaerospermopsis aphanizomenoides]MBK1988950.1 hypothetical protein [Sphaerospermopsis aphanizomenoides BCCUSP55]